MQLHESQQPPVQGFCCAIRQGLGERSANCNERKRKLPRSGLLVAQGGIQRQGRFQIAHGLFKVSSTKMD